MPELYDGLGQYKLLNLIIGKLKITLNLPQIEISKAWKKKLWILQKIAGTEAQMAKCLPPCLVGRINQTYQRNNQPNTIKENPIMASRL